MTKRNIAVIVTAMALAALMLLVAGCKSQEQIEAEKTVTQAAPNITFNVPLEGEDVITVNGSGKVSAQPDMATVTFSVRTQDKDAATAQELNTQAMDAVTAAIKALGVTDADIQTGYVQLYEMYDYDKNPPTVTGFEMSNEIIVTVHELDSLGGIMSAAIAAGATNAGGVNFQMSDTAAEYASALKAAMQDAFTKATALAQAAGCTIEAVPVSVTESSTSATPVEYREYDMAVAAAEPAAESSVSISTAELDVEARVSVVYRIVK